MTRTSQVDNQYIRILIFLTCTKRIINYIPKQGGQDIIQI